MSSRQPPLLSVRWVHAALAAYASGFVLFWPRVFLVGDEERYASQAMAFARGGTTIRGAEILFPPTRVDVISNYPPGTSLLQVPFVWALGWRGAAILSVLALVLATLVTARWLRENGYQAAFALLIPGFFGASFFGRIAMSDVPSAALVAVTCHLLWRAERGAWTISLLAGFCAGLSLLFREPLIVLLAPLLLGAALRRRAVTWALIAGAAAGVLLRIGLSELLFDSALYVRDSGYGFSVGSLSHNLPVYGIILLLMFPGGAILPFLYRGPRRREMVISALLYITIFVFYEYDSIRVNGPVKGLILAARFMVPLVPVLAFMAADVWPRLYARSRGQLRAATDLLARGAAIAAVALAFAVHLLVWREERVPLAIVRGIYSHTSENSPVITNSNATLKYLSPSYGPRRLILRYYINSDSVAAFAKRFDTLSVALLDRTDSEMFRLESQDNDRFVGDVRRRCTVEEKYRARPGDWAELQIFHLSRCR